MTNSGADPSPSGRPLPDGISCVGALFLVVMILAALGVGLGSTAIGGNNQTSKIPSGEATKTLPSLARVSPTPLPVEGASIVLSPSSPHNPEIASNTPISPTIDPADNLLNRSTLRSESTFELVEGVRPIPLPTPKNNYSLTQKIPILMYHYISQPPENADEYRQDLSVLPGEFKAQMQYLVDNGYESIDLYALSHAVVGNYDLPAKPVIITLDDGYRDNYENAFPILQELGLKATFFIVTEPVDRGNPSYMDWRMIEEMAAAGMRIEPHSKTHPNLTEHERDFIIWEVLGSAETLETHIKYRPRYFAYPGGWYNEEVQQIVAELDFWGAVTTSHGLSHGYNDRFGWNRVRIRGTTTIDELAEMIE